ncbi:ABC transporter permease subunit [Clostridium estertheticum]|uniref:ABC transporter permease subunit n=1 Tax=Clostridium estertheticum TaxID=238834 RepID=UPI001C7D3211|nr:ABC transporter permease subunit [Clostridium estertheticum]MBX4264635.1 ABC transporter permease subunit [Clostridium estertheticum]MBX4268313.1 ABC transporter permease subunit [Clostridium estertheticum]WLC81617.1 ABC transporter permease subunit [Clostridium estertheticum]WLC88770.1 ABC transporter permease subunit [Clostridium estertheticum]
MNKIINKALFYKEWINVRWVTLLTIITLLFYKVYGVISLLNRNKMYMEYNIGSRTDRWFNNGLYGMNSYYFVMVLVVIILTIILFKGEKTSETQGFIASMPFTRKEIIINKWLVGVVSLLISFVITYIFLSLFYFANINGLGKTLNPYSDIVKWFFMDTFQYICIFTFIMLVQAVMGNSIVSGMVGGIILGVPIFISMVVKELGMRYYQYSRSISTILEKISGWTNIYNYNVAKQKSFHPNSAENVNQDYYQNFYYSNYNLKLLVLFLLTCLFLFLAYVAYRKRNIEYNLRLIVFKNLEPVFVCGIAICSGLLAGVIFGESGLKASFGIYFVIFTIIGYFISKLLLKGLSSRK